MNLKKHQSIIVRWVDDARRQLVGCEVRLNTPRAGRYYQRIGAVHDVIPDAKHGLLVLVMIFYHGQSAGSPGSSAYLNSHVLTRSYWPLKDLIFTGRIVF